MLNDRTRVWFASSVCLIATAPALGLTSESTGAGTLEHKGLSFRVEPDAALSNESEASARVGAVEYASKGSRWWTLGAGVAYDFDDATDVPLRGAYSYFLDDGVEFSAEVGAWYFSQPGDDAVGLSGSVILRWHFLRRDPWTAYVDAGIGIVGSSDDVPQGGTSFNFLPQAGAGVTRRLNDDGLRLQLGLRWHHISNARIQGDDENPDRDAPMIYAGLIFPF